jgi:hypothetical protein
MKTTRNILENHKNWSLKSQNFSCRWRQWSQENERLSIKGITVVRFICASFNQDIILWAYHYHIIVWKFLFTPMFLLHSSNYFFCPWINISICVFFLYIIQFLFSSYIVFWCLSLPFANIISTHDSGIHDPHILVVVYILRQWWQNLEVY